MIRIPSGIMKLSKENKRKVGITMKKAMAALLAAALIVGGLTGCSGEKKAEPAGTETAGNKTEASDSAGKDAAETEAAVTETDAAETETATAADAASKTGGELVVYSACNEDILGTVIPLFEEETGIKVELLTGGVGELLKRVESESENPYCDVVLGGTESQFYNYMDQFQEYVSPNDSAMLEGHHSYENKLTPINTDAAVIMWNNNLIGDTKVASYKDLLQPELKGKIALPDPASSGTGAGTIADLVWLYNDGKWDGDAGWKMVEDFTRQLDGKVSGSSGNAHKSVADGENTITVTYEGAAFAYLKNGADVGICYPEEGVIASNAMMAIVKDCANPDNAKALVDFMTSKEVQNLFGTELMSRPVRADAELADFIPAADTIHYFERSQEEFASHKTELIERFNEIFADVQE